MPAAQDQFAWTAPARQLLPHAPQLWTSVNVSGWFVSAPSQFASILQPSCVPPARRRSPDRRWRRRRRPSCRPCTARSRRRAAGWARCRRRPSREAPCRRVVSIMPSQSSSSPLQVSGRDRSAPTQTSAPFWHCSVPNEQGKMLLMPQALPTSVGLSSTTPSQSSSLPLQSLEALVLDEDVGADADDLAALAHGRARRGRAWRTRRRDRRSRSTPICGSPERSSASSILPSQSLSRPSPQISTPPLVRSHWYSQPVAYGAVEVPPAVAGPLQSHAISHCVFAGVAGRPAPACSQCGVPWSDDAVVAALAAVGGARAEVDVLVLDAVAVVVLVVADGVVRAGRDAVVLAARGGRSRS